MNIAHLSVGDPFTARLANNQANNGHNVHLIMLKKESEIFHGVNKYYLPFKPPLGYILNFLHLRKLLKIIKPDIFHVHYASGNGFLGRLGGGVKPSVLSAWGSDVMVVPKKSKIMYKVVKKNLNYYEIKNDHLNLRFHDNNQNEFGKVGFNGLSIKIIDDQSYLNIPHYSLFNFEFVIFGENQEIKNPRAVESLKQLSRKETDESIEPYMGLRRLLRDERGALPQGLVRYAREEGEGGVRGAAREV